MRKLRIPVIMWSRLRRTRPTASPVVVSRRIPVRQLGLATGQIVIVRRAYARIARKIEVKYIP